MGEGWTTLTSSPLICLDESEPHFITIVGPGEQTHRFQAVPRLNGQATSCTGANYLSGATVNLLFQPLPGTAGSLVALNDPRYLLVDINSITLREYRDDLTQPLGPIYDPMEFRFTALDGRQFQFNAAG